MNLKLFYYYFITSSICKNVYKKLYKHVNDSWDEMLEFKHGMEELGEVAMMLRKMQKEVFQIMKMDF